MKFLIASLGLHNRKKLVATACRCERVYKRTGKPSETFCERGATTERIRKGRTQCDIFENSVVRCDEQHILARSLLLEYHIIQMMKQKNTMW